MAGPTLTPLLTRLRKSKPRPRATQHKPVKSHPSPEYTGLSCRCRPLPHTINLHVDMHICAAAKIPPLPCNRSWKTIGILGRSFLILYLNVTCCAGEGTTAGASWRALAPPPATTPQCGHAYYSHACPFLVRGWGIVCHRQNYCPP